jgi:hypothetical protein
MAEVVRKPRKPRTINRFARLLANGEWEYFTCPRFIDLTDIAKHCSTSVLCFFLPKGWTAFGEKQTYEGPIWAVWDKQKCTYVAGWKDLAQVPLEVAYQYA